MATKRKHELSLMNLWLCLLVIFIHVMSYAVTNFEGVPYAVSIVLQRFSSYAVQGFIFLSAVKFSFGAKRESFSYSRYYLTRVTRIILPYIFVSVVYYAWFVWRSYYAFNVKEFFTMLLNGTMTSHFYFIIIIVQFYLLAPLWRKLIKWLSNPFRIVFAVLTALFVQIIYGQYLAELLAIINPDSTYQYADRTFTTYILYWILGLAVGCHYEKFLELIRKSFRAVSVVWLFAAVNQGVLSYLNCTGKANYRWLEFVHMFYVLSSIFFTFGIMQKLANKKIAELAPVRILDKASYQIYLWHILPIYVFEYHINDFGINSVYTVFFIRFAFVFGVSLILCGLYARIKEKITKKK